MKPDGKNLHPQYLLLLRSLCVFIAIILTIIGYYEEHYYHSTTTVWEWFGVGIAYVVVMMLTYINTWIRRQLPHLMVTLTLLTIYFYMIFTYRNSFDPRAAYTLSMCFFIIGMYGATTFKQLVTIDIFVLLSILLTILLVATPGVNVVSYFLFVLSMCVFSITIFGSKMKLEAVIHDREQLIDAVFLQSSDALFIVDKKTGHVERANERVMFLFDVHHIHAINLHIDEFLKKMKIPDNNKSIFWKELKLTNSPHHVNLYLSTGQAISAELKATDIVNTKKPQMLVSIATSLPLEKAT